MLAGNVGESMDEAQLGPIPDYGEEAKRNGIAYCHNLKQVKYRAFNFLIKNEMEYMF